MAIISAIKATTGEKKLFNKNPILELQFGLERALQKSFM